MYVIYIYIYFEVEGTIDNQTAGLLTTTRFCCLAEWAKVWWGLWNEMPMEVLPPDHRLWHGSEGVFPSIYLCTYLPTYLPIYLSTYLSIYLSIYLSTCLPTYLSIYLCWSFLLVLKGTAVATHLQPRQLTDLSIKLARAEAEVSEAKSQAWRVPWLVPEEANGSQALYGIL